MQAQRYLSIPLLLAFAVGLHAQTVPFTIEVRDSDTHYAVQAKVKLEGPKSISTETDKTGKLSVALPPGSYEEEISAAGYQTLKGPTPPYGSRAVMVLIVPQQRPPELASLDSQVRPGYTLLYGYAVDQDGQPLENVPIRMQGESIETATTTTNARGFFSVMLPTPPETPDPVDHMPIPGTADLTAEKLGYKTQLHSNIPLGKGWAGMFLDMKRGSGTVQTDETPAWMEHGKSVPGDEDDSPQATSEQTRPAEAQGNPKSPGSPVIGTISLPPTIVVGTGCPTKWQCQNNNPNGPCYFTNCQHNPGCPANCPVPQVRVVILDANLGSGPGVALPRLGQRRAEPGAPG